MASLAKNFDGKKIRAPTRTLDDCLANRSQVPADEIIVVDDGSTDGMVETAWAAFRRSESGKVKGEKSGGVEKPVTCHSSTITSPDFRVICQENAGPGTARNRGFAESNGEFIHFFDSDDIAVPNKHEVQMRALQHDEADIAIGPWQKGTFEDGSFLPFQHALQQRGLPKGSLAEALLSNWSLVPHCCLFRREIVERAGLMARRFAGFKQRIVGNCALRSFCAGPLTKNQIALIEKAGYKLAC